MKVKESLRENKLSLRSCCTGARVASLCLVLTSQFEATTVAHLPTPCSTWLTRVSALV